MPPRVAPREDPNIVSGYDAERLEQRLQSLSIPAEFKLFVRGHNAVEEILNLVTPEQVSLLVIGLRKRIAVGKLLLGSVAHDILMTVPLPGAGGESRHVKPVAADTAAQPLHKNGRPQASRFFVPDGPMLKNQ